MESLSEFMTRSEKCGKIGCTFINLLSEVISVQFIHHLSFYSITVGRAKPGGVVKRLDDERGDGDGCKGWKKDEMGRAG